MRPTRPAHLAALPRGMLRHVLLTLSLLFSLLGAHGALAQSMLVNRGPTLPSGSTMKIGEALVSPSGEFFATTQSDGNLCVSHESDRSGVWCTRSTSAGEAQYVTGMQTDGNLCTAAGSHVAWCLTDRARHDGPFFLAMQDDANLCVYNGVPGRITGTVWCSMGLATVRPHGPKLVYGKAYYLKNGYANWSGGYLDTAYSGCERNAMCVSTAVSEARDQRSGSWVIKSAQGKTDGSPVMPGDKVYLKNLYPLAGDPEPPYGQFGGYLDTRGSGCEGNVMCVSTSLAMDGNNSIWTVEIDRFNLYLGQAIRLRNGYDNTYLDTRNRGCEGNLLCVSTSASADRDQGSGSWRFEATLDTYAARYAPRLRFDTDAHGYPMSAQPFFEQAVQRQQTATIQNTDPNSLGSGRIPTYYQAIKVGNQVRIKYWWFYGYQNTCDGINGSHNGDWEDVTVILAEDRNSIAAVVFTMHGEHYTRLAARNAFQIEDVSHPVVYVGKTSHAAFFDGGGSSNSCLPWEEYRNNNSGTRLDTWTRLLNLDDNGEAWMRTDRTTDFKWGRDGVSTHPTRSGPSAEMNAAAWSAGVPTWWHSDCKFGDRDDGTYCVEACRSGYTDGGYLCTNWSTWHSYTVSTYRYDYRLPTSDRGLLVKDE
ncbi:hypothetical protein [Pseudoduganella chitinolytica]|uniref:Bulb-type lectin domain-containing protein n=1 Tax=Pseudoduganella chitinolytica TaxID=34070 RepID=A0ABY8BEQ1_9BURK|nr:hypothetical protein [Pseudoduganella chitinolytica]WEF33202.1 hypothetical protein PX653_28090 [Pseudoduganella chitinolytica]